MQGMAQLMMAGDGGAPQVIGFDRICRFFYPSSTVYSSRVRVSGFGFGGYAFGVLWFRTPGLLQGSTSSV